MDNAERKFQRWVWEGKEDQRTVPTPVTVGGRGMMTMRVYPLHQRPRAQAAPGCPSRPCAGAATRITKNHGDTV
eukprot:7622670-Pyramimonas_sp.AAC.1